MPDGRFHAMLLTAFLVMSGASGGPPASPESSIAALDATAPERIVVRPVGPRPIDVSPAAPSTTDAPPPPPKRSEAPEPRSEAGLAATAAPSTDPPDRPGPITSPDVGDHCADSLTAADLTTLFSEPLGDVGGADYQRALRLPDDRVLWTFQDAFVGRTLVHNIGMVQSGRCFTVLPHGEASWLLDESTTPLHRWHWILGGGIGRDSTLVDLFVVEMEETGPRYLSRTRPVALRRVVLDATTLDVVDTVDVPTTGNDLYGWSVTDDAQYTYLYSHCYQQFGYEGALGFGECVADVKLARVPLGDFDADREYWDGDGWSTDHEQAAPVVDGSFVFSGNNPAQIRVDGQRYLLVEKRDDWFGDTVEFGVADDPQGPFEHVASVAQPLRCDAATCNSYFAAWLPWNGADGDPIWSISHNRWDGSQTHRHLDDYRPSFAEIELAA